MRRSASIASPLFPHAGMARKHSGSYIVLKPEFLPVPASSDADRQALPSEKS